MSDWGSDDLPGGYDTLDGIKARAIALGEPTLATVIERAEERVYYDDDAGGYRIESPEADDVKDAEMFFHFGILAGAALEREYPAPDQEADE